MCGRMVMELTPELLATVFGTPKAPDLSPIYNIAPTQLVLIVRQTGGLRRLEQMRWGLVPSWARDPAVGSRMINARSETVAVKPSFRHAIRYRRCIVPASGYFEWQRDGKKNRPFYFWMKDNSPLGLAGIWEEWQGADGSTMRTFAVLTTTANRIVAPVHDRMPVILATSEYTVWLDREITDPESLQALYHPFPAELLDSYSVSELVNSPRNNGPELIARAADLSLFPGA